MTHTGIDDRIEQLLRDGATKAEIREQLGCSRHRIYKVQQARGLPDRKPGPRPGRGRTDAQVFAERTEPGDDGHLYWVGHTRPDGVPTIRGTTAYRVAWRLGTGTEPDGVVRPTCGMSACVALAHLTCKAPRGLADAVTSMPHLRELIDGRRVPVEPGGHMRWIGHADVRGVPALRYGHPTDAIQSTAYRFIWLLATGTEPVGIVRPTCGMPRCVADTHLHDTGAAPDATEHDKDDQR